MSYQWRRQVRAEVNRSLSARQDVSRTTSNTSSGIALGVSIIGLLVSAFTFYFTSIQPPRITLKLGNVLAVHHLHDGHVALWLTLAFANASERGGTIERSALLLRRVPTKEYTYIVWEAFNDPASNDYVYHAAATALAVPARSVVSQDVRFGWYPETKPKLKLLPGKYDLTVLAWTAEAQRPQLAVHHTFTITERAASEIEANELAGRFSPTIKPTIRFIFLDMGKLNQTLTESEAARVLPPSR